MKCQHCKQKYGNEFEVCPSCGFSRRKSEKRLFIKKLILIFGVFCLIELGLIVNDVLVIF